MSPAPRQGPTDADLLALVRAAADAVDPVPEGVLAAARASLTWLDVDAELARLVEDSALTGAVGVRSGGGPRLLTFEGGQGDVVLVEVEERPGDRRRLTGQLVPGRPVDVEVRRTSGSSTVRADELGRFALDDVEAGPLSLACRLEEGRGALVTPWTSV
ncbi:hypothetical protein [Vallicoccus soli]|uniref:Carboxypeptidase regulatory-like domain-containing protein n=1 Tax=Vallicoccus soli TaxID=2339232 RepID=A0A3A3YZM3_9ACTN|nr:hypothetical protein [Vallicoccus soli]RJK96271.1 hypothetical protein D5H78_08390 [Vallicoccus soli]